MTKLALGFLIVLITTGLFGSSHAGGLECSNTQDSAASDRLSKANSLASAYKIHTLYPGCLAGGGLSEEMSDRVAKILLKSWRESLLYFGGGTRHREIALTMVGYLGATNDRDDLGRLEFFSRRECLPAAKVLCGKILDQISESKYSRMSSE